MTKRWIKKKEKGRSRVKMCRGNSKLVGFSTPMKHTFIIKGSINKTE